MSLTFSRPILHGANRLHMAVPPPHRRPSRPPGIAIGTLIIQDGKGFGVAQAIRMMERRGLDVMLLTEKNIQTKAYSQNKLGYKVTFLAACPSSSGSSQGLVGLVTREWPNIWGVKSMRFHGTNMVSCDIVTGHTRTLFVCAYLPPLTLDRLLGF